MEKPTKLPARFDYLDCASYLEQKYGFSDRDFYFRNRAIWSASDKALAQTLEKFGNTSFWNATPTDYTEEQVAQKDFYTEIRLELEKDAPSEVLDFWYDVLVEHYDVKNGAIFDIYEFQKPEKVINTPEYEKIFNWIMEEFGKGEVGARAVYFEVSW